MQYTSKPPDMQPYLHSLPSLCLPHYPSIATPPSLQFPLLLSWFGSTAQFVTTKQHNLSLFESQLFQSPSPIYSPFLLLLSFFPFLILNFPDLEPFFEKVLGALVCTSPEGSGLGLSIGALVCSSPEGSGLGLSMVWTILWQTSHVKGQASFTSLFSLSLLHHLVGLSVALPIQLQFCNLPEPSVNS